MALVTVLSQDRQFRHHLQGVFGTRYVMAETASWDRFGFLVRERPATLALVDLVAIPAGRSRQEALLRFRREFPHLGMVLLVRRGFDPGLLFQMGRLGIRNLVHLDVDELEPEILRAFRRAGGESASGQVVRAVAPHLPPRPLRAVHLAMDGVHRCWKASEFAAQLDLSRPFLSECLKSCGLPSAGHLLIWARLLHAGHWLTEPGRTAESVSRQLEYSSGAAFRRALKHYTGATPTQVVSRGGLSYVLGHFMAACGFKARRSAFVA